MKPNFSFTTPKTEQDFIAIYDYIYKITTLERRPSFLTEKEFNSAKSYGAYLKRANCILNYVRANIEPPCKILDASCGRGLLLRTLLEDGYDAYGTEVSDTLLMTYLSDLPVIKRAYSKYSLFSDNEFDIIISSDVLEHLSSIEAVYSALRQFQRIARTHIFVSVCERPAPKFPKFLHLTDVIQDLHTVQLSVQKWETLLSKYMAIEHTHFFKQSLFAFGRPK